MPASAVSEAATSAVVSPAALRNSRPSMASNIASSAVRSRPMRCANAGVVTPNSANAAVGSMPNTPVMVAPKPNVSPSVSSSGVSEVTAVRRLKADSTMPSSTSPRPDQRDAGAAVCVSVESMAVIIGDEMRQDVAPSGTVCLDYGQSVCYGRPTG